MDKGERFVAASMAVILFSYQTPWTWGDDATFLVIVFGIGTIVNVIANARERRVW